MLHYHPSQPFSGIARILVMSQLFSESQITFYLSEAQKAAQSLINYLINNKLCSAFDIANAAAKAFGLPLLDLSQVAIDTLPQDIIQPHLLQQYRVLPLEQCDGSLLLAVEDPTQLEMLQDLQFHTSLQPRAIIVESDQLTTILAMVLNQQTQQSLVAHLEREQQHQGAPASILPVIPIDDAPIVKYLQQIIADAIERRASDIHFENYGNSYRIRFRIDGLLITVATPPQSIAERIAARLKVMANLDIAIRRLPQDGRCKITTTQQEFDIRVSTCPCVDGEKIVLRILQPHSSKLAIDALGLHPEQMALCLQTLQHPQGMILVTGPTGSGKTVSLYSALELLNQDSKNIISVEDPVEIKIPGINQININVKSGLDFATTLRAVLRQDPDIIMIGEIRDLETAEIAIKAAQTGHLVLATLHTNNAAQTLTRLAYMGIKTYNIASSISLIIAQRLIRRLCQHCRTPYHHHDRTLYQAVGCDYCTQGYQGRVGIFELLAITPEVREMIIRRAPDTEISHISQQHGMCTLYQAGLIQVYNGVTSMQELQRMLGEGEYI